MFPKCLIKCLIFLARVMTPTKFCERFKELYLDLEFKSQLYLDLFFSIIWIFQKKIWRCKRHATATRTAHQHNFDQNHFKRPKPHLFRIEGHSYTIQVFWDQVFCQEQLSVVDDICGVRVEVASACDPSRYNSALFRQ